MRDIDPAFRHHLHQVSIAEFVSEIPADTENNDCAIKVATGKHRGPVRRRLIHVTDYQPNSAFAPEPYSFSEAVLLLLTNFGIEPAWLM
jgi:hypothetical protein